MFNVPKPTFEPKEKPAEEKWPKNSILPQTQLSPLSPTSVLNATLTCSVKSLACILRPNLPNANRLHSRVSALAPHAATINVSAAERSPSTSQPRLRYSRRHASIVTMQPVRVSPWPPLRLRPPCRSSTIARSPSLSQSSRPLRRTRTPPRALARARQPASPSSLIFTSRDCARRANSATFGVNTHSLYPCTSAGWLSIRKRASASRTRGRLILRAAEMMNAIVDCISGSRPRPGPMTMACILVKRSMTGAASEVGDSGLGVSRRRGCTIRFGE